MSIAIESKREYNRTRVNEGNTNDNGHECCDAHNGEDSGNVSFVSVSIAKATVMVVLNSSVKRYVCHRVTPRSVCRVVKPQLLRIGGINAAHNPLIQFTSFLVI